MHWELLLILDGADGGPSGADLPIAATAHANGLDLYTRNGDDFSGLDDLVRVIAL